MLSPKIRNKVRISTLTTSIQHDTRTGNGKVIPFVKQKFKKYQLGKINTNERKSILEIHAKMEKKISISF